MWLGLKFTEQLACFEVISHKTVQEIAVRLRTKTSVLLFQMLRHFFRIVNQLIQSSITHPISKIPFNISLL